MPTSEIGFADVKAAIATALAKNVTAHLRRAFPTFATVKCARSGWHWWSARVGDDAAWHLLLQTSPKDDEFTVATAWTRSSEALALPGGMHVAGPLYAADAGLVSAPGVWEPLPRLSLKTDLEIIGMNCAWRLMPTPTIDQRVNRLLAGASAVPGISDELLDALARDVVGRVVRDGADWLARSSGIAVRPESEAPTAQLDEALLPRLVARASAATSRGRRDALVASVQRAVAAEHTMNRFADGDEGGHRENSDDE